jgi:HEAT repeat protein
MQLPQIRLGRFLPLLATVLFFGAELVAQNTNPQPPTPLPHPSGPLPNPRAARREPNNDPARWEKWWHCNKEDYLIPRAVWAPDVAGDLYTGTLAAPMEQEIRSAVIPLLEEALKDNDHEVRAAAAIALGKAGDWREIKTLIAAVNDRERSVSEAAILAVGLLGEGSVEQTLRDVFNDTTRTARERGLAAIALGYSGGDVARGVLFEQLGATTDAEGRGRLPGIEADRFLGAALWAGADKKDGGTERSPLAASLLQRALSMPSIKDRAILGIGSAALSKTRDAGSLQYIMRALSDSRADVRAGAGIAAGRVIKADDKRSVAALISAISAEGDTTAKRFMLISLGRIGGPEARKKLLEELDAGLRQDRSFAALALGVSGATDLAPRLRREFEAASDDSLKGSAAIALGIMHDPEALKPIGEVAKVKNNPELLKHLMWFLALDRGRGSAVIAEQVALEAKVADVHEAASIALGLIGSLESQAILIKHLAGPGPVTLRRASAIGLARMGDRRGVQPLIKAYKVFSDPQIVRAGAITALGILCQRNVWPPFARVSIDSNYDIENDAIDFMKDLP